VHGRSVRMGTKSGGSNVQKVRLRCQGGKSEDEGEEEIQEKKKKKKWKNPSGEGEEIHTKTGRENFTVWRGGRSIPNKRTPRKQIRAKETFSLKGRVEEPNCNPVAPRTKGLQKESDRPQRLGSSRMGGGHFQKWGGGGAEFSDPQQWTKFPEISMIIGGRKRVSSTKCTMRIQEIKKRLPNLEGDRSQ